MESFVHKLRAYYERFDHARGVNKKVIEHIRKKDYLITENEFYYLVDYKESKTIFVSDQIRYILGYEPAEFTVEKITNSIHPDDVKKVACIVLSGIDWCQVHGIAPFKTIFTISYRVKHKMGYYIKILRKTIMLDVSDDNLLLASLSICSNISELKKDNEVTYSFTGPGTKGFTVPKYDLNVDVSLITKREKMVLQQLSKGISSQQISEILNIAKSTVDDHRRNMLRKTGLKNSVELVVYGIQNDLITV